VLAACEVRRGLGRVLDALVDHLTDRGLLDTDVAEIAAANGFARADVLEALRAVKVVGPPGIGERTVPDLLAVQADQLVHRGVAPPWVVPLIRHHLNLIADDDATRAAELFDAEPSLVADVFALVRQHLRPAAVFDGNCAPAPVGSPDVYIRLDKAGDLHVDTPDSRWFGLRIADIEPRVAGDREARQFLGRYERDARTLLAQLDARSDVLNQVALWAARWQRDYLERGPIGHQDLTRSAVADHLGLHPSTVARAVAGKVARTPNGAFIQLSELFGTGVAVRAELAELLRHRQFSDARLAEELARRGHRVARRTVAKYRAQLGMAAATPKLTS
jgi:RNA polymerase sigma-54 factor